MSRFLLIVGGSYALVNAWILWWAWRSLAGTGWLRAVVPLAILGWALCFPLLYKGGSNSITDVLLLRFGSLWLGIFVYVLFFVLVADVCGLLRMATGITLLPFPPQRICFLALGLSMAIGSASWINAAYPVVTEYELTVPVTGEMPAKLANRTVTIGALSDMHLGRTITPVRLARALALLKPYEPDAVFFLGDMLDDHVRVDMRGMQAALAQLDPPMGMWGVVGNHEYYSGDIDASVSILEESGMHVLRDAWHVLDESLLVVGRDDRVGQRLTGQRREDLHAITAKVPEAYRSLPMIVLDHQPVNLAEAQAVGAALQLSGHTHNGQLWPFNLLVKRLFENPYGLTMRGNTHIIVSVGAGTWGPPMRNNARPEVVLLRLRFVPDAGQPDIAPHR